MRIRDRKAQARRTQIALAFAAATFASLSTLAPGATDETSAPTQPHSVAVLDFVNRNLGDGRDWLGKGLADMAITDLSASGRLIVLDRERMQEVARELEAMTTGLFDERTAPRAGQIAKARWVLFGSFLCKGDRVALEALLIDVTKQQTLRIEQVEGPLATVFDLEQRLTAMVLAKLNSPMTEEEVRLVKLLQTESLPAFEHYSRALGLFDRGQWYDALTETRLAVKADPGYTKAAMRLADLYHDVGEPEHAVAEYGRLVDADPEGKLPEELYFRMARMLGDTLRDHEGAARVLECILRQHKSHGRAFRITDPPGRSHRWEQARYSRGAAGAPAAPSPLVYMKALERLASWHWEAGRPFEAAESYSMIVRFACTEEAPVGPENVVGPFLREVMEKYTPLYWRFVLENRDATLYPARTVHLLPEAGGARDPKAKPTHFAHRMESIWLAPPGLEIAGVRFALEPDRPDKEREKVRDMLRGKLGKEYALPAREELAFFLCPGYADLLGNKGTKVHADGAWHSRDLPPGVRALECGLDPYSRWRLEFSLRKWSPGKRATVPAAGTLSLRVCPPHAALFLDGKPRGRTLASGWRVPPGGKGRMVRMDPPLGSQGWRDVAAGEHTVEVRWPDGRSRAEKVIVEPGQEARVLLNADCTRLSRRVLAPRGSYTCLLADPTGRLWLLWDEAVWEGWDAGRKPDSDLYAVVSPDGIHWMQPRRLPVSSLAYDAHPVLQQDGRGRFWLVWESDRDPEELRSLWIASSPNGVAWSFPRKIALPKTAEGDVERWRKDRNAQFAFAVDPRGTFWLVWQGWLLRSQDAERWGVDGVLHTDPADAEAADNERAKHYHLSCERDGTVLLFANSWKAKADSLWRRTGRGEWTCLGPLSQLAEPFRSQLGPGSFAPQRNGTLLFATLGFDGLAVHEQGGALAAPRTFWVENIHVRPFHPSVAALPGGRFAVAYGSTEGLIAATFQRTEPSPGTKGTE